MILPKTPVKRITATVIVTMPPSSSEIPIPIAVVTDLGSKVTYSLWSRRKRRDKRNTQERLVITPDRIRP